MEDRESHAIVEVERTAKKLAIPIVVCPNPAHADTQKEVPYLV